VSGKAFPREAVAFTFCIVLAVAFTWPLVLQLDTAVPDRGDPVLNAWIIDWVCHALTHDPLHLYDAPMYYPARYPLAYSENMVGIALFVLPLHLAGLPALVVYNLALILGFALSGYGAWILARLVTGSTAGALVGAIFYAFTSFRLAHINHVQIVWGGWLALLLAAFLAYWRKPTTGRAVLLGVAFLMNGLTNIHWLLFGGFALLLTIGFLATADVRKDRGFWIRLAVALAVAGALLLPFLIPYRIISEEYGASRTSEEARVGSATWTSWATPSGRNVLYGSIADARLHRDEHELFPGLLVLFLTAYACATRERREVRIDPVPRPARIWLYDTLIVLFATITYFTAIADRITIGHFSFSGPDVPAMITVVLLIARNAGRLRAAVRNSRFSLEELSAGLWIVAGLVASAGWNLFLHPFLFRLVGPFRATRAPVRWASIVCVGLAVWAAVGTRDLLARRGPATRRAIAAALIGLALIEVIPAIAWQHVDPVPAPVYRWLAAARPRAMLELPMVADGIPYRYLLASTTHRVPLMNGASGWEPPLAERLRVKESLLQYDDKFLRDVREGGGSMLVVHEALLTDAQRRALAPLLRELKPLCRFGSDAVYDVR
jgi:hypothetical protein